MLIHEIEDGKWAAAGLPNTLESIIDFVAPGYEKLTAARSRAADPIAAP